MVSKVVNTTQSKAEGMTMALDALGFALGTGCNKYPAMS